MTIARLFKPDSIHSLAGVEPTLPPNDLMVLGGVVARAKIVALGEPTHGQKEINQLRDRITRYLVEHQEFRVVAMEDSAIKCRLVNDYIVHGEGNALSALQQQNFWTWRTRELLAMIEWLRDWNLTHPDKAVQFIGVDIQDFASPASELLRVLMELDAELGLQYHQTLANLGSIELRDGQSVNAVATACYFQTLAEIHRFISTAHDISPRNRDIGLDCVLALEQALRLWKAIADSPDEWLAEEWNCRDETMATRAIAPTTSGKKVVLWAHNGHVQSENGDHLPPGAVTTGSVLREHLSMAYVVISGIFGSGSYRGYDVGGGGMGVLDVGTPPNGTLEHELYVTTHADALLIDLRAAGSILFEEHGTRWAGAELVPGAEMMLGVRPALGSDAIAFVRHASPSRPI